MDAERYSRALKRFVLDKNYRIEFSVSRSF